MQTQAVKAKMLLIIRQAEIAHIFQMEKQHLQVNLERLERERGQRTVEQLKQSFIEVLIIVLVVVVVVSFLVTTFYH